MSSPFPFAPKQAGGGNVGDFSVEFVGVPEFAGALNRSPEIFRSELSVAAAHISVQGQQRSQAYAPVATGELRGSIYRKIQAGAGGVSAIWGSPLNRAIFSERGRGPGKMPPQGALLGYPGVTPENEFVIRRAIGRRGIKPHPFVGRAFEELRSGFAQREFSAAIGRALAKIGGR